MRDEDNSVNTVVFTKAEMDSFEDDACLELSNDELTSRMGVELRTVEVLVDSDESDNRPPGIDSEIYHDYSFFADKLNPTQLIIDGEYEDDFFRINRPKDLSEVEDILQSRLQEITNERELDEDYERERQMNEREDWD
jgi:hypothetical protein